MAIKSTQLAIKTLFEQNHTFMVPKYQRGYAWDDEAIEDFVEDMGRCLNVRLSGKIPSHFFGGIVTVRTDVAGSNRSNYEVIDGQQRLASFVLLVAAIVSGMRNIIGDLVKKGTALDADESKAKSFLEETVDTLTKNYLTYRDEIELKYTFVPKLKLSNADHDFFQSTIEGKEPKPSRDSHERILTAWNLLQAFVANEVLKTGPPLEKSARVRHMVNYVMASDCSVIFMCSGEKNEAYQIFQVMNDRGVHLSDGDLLRASTLEILDASALAAIQNEVAKHWDSVLAYPTSDIDDYLRWYFSSWQGKRPNSSNLADQFLDNRFKCKEKKIATEEEANAILKEVQQLESELGTLDTMRDGEWPYSDHSQIDRWDSERLRMLVVHLKHTNAMPLLLSLQTLEPKKFAEALAAIERFVFRYKTIGNAHVTPMTIVYLDHAKKIRAGGTYNVQDLRTALAGLIAKHVPDPAFKAQFDLLRYNPKGGNSTLRYLLITLEDYSRWFEQGAQGIPQCIDKTRVFDFSNTTLEHVYPQSAKGAAQNADLEKVKHALGNLTIFGPSDNGTLGNKTFAEKRDMLSGSNLNLNRKVGANPVWDAGLVVARTQQIYTMALKIFLP
jgi:hypothetical protein